jgi:hypothetical protein
MTKVVDPSSRKTFSGRGGVKLIVPLREQNGRAQRPPLHHKERLAEIVSIAEAQPHRRQSESPRSVDLATPVGRLLHAGAMLPLPTYGPRSFEAANFLIAARRYGDAWAGMRWVMASRRPWAVAGWKPEKVFESAEAETAYANDLERKWRDAEGSLRDTLDKNGERIGDRCRKALQALILDAQEETWVPPHWVVYYGEKGLWTLVKYYQLGVDKRG